MATATFTIENFSLKSTWTYHYDPHYGYYNFGDPSTATKTVRIDLSSIRARSRVISATLAIKTTGVGDSAARKEGTSSWKSVTNDHTNPPIDVTSWLDSMSGSTFGTLGIDFNFKAYGGTSAGSNTSNFTNMVLTVNYELPNSTGTLSPNPVTAGSTLTLTINPVNQNYSHVATLTFGNQTDTNSISAGTTSTSWTIPLSWLSQIPNASSGTATVQLITKNGNDTVGSVTYNVTIKVPSGSSAAPTTGTLAVSPAATTIPYGWENIYVQGYSKLSLSLNNPAGQYGSTIRSVVFSGWGESIAATKQGTSTYVAESGILPTNGTKTITATVTDSRGKTSSTSTTITVVPYQKPTITSITARRCLNDMTAVDTGTYVRLNVVYSFSSVIVNGQETNEPTNVSLYKQSNHENYTDAQVSFVSGTPVVIGGGNISADQTYQIKATVTDHAGNTASAIVSVPTATYVLHFKNGGTSVGIGQAALDRSNAFVVNKNWAAYIGDADVAKYPWCLEYKGNIEQNTNLNTCTIPGIYGITSNVASTLQNLPSGNKAGKLMVFATSGGNDRDMSLSQANVSFGQAYMPYDCSAVYLRHIYTGSTAGSVTCGAWKSFISGDGINASAISSGELPIARGGTGASTKDGAFANLGFQAGNNITFGTSTCFTGVITDSNEQAIFTIPVGRHIDANNVSVSGTGYLHTSAGKITSTSASNFSTWGTVSATFNSSGFVILTIRNTSKFPGTNNTVAVLQVDNMTISFT